MEKKAQFDFNLVTVGILYLLSFIFFEGTFRVLDEASRVFPRVISILAAFLATLLLIRALVFKKRDEFNFEGGMKVISITAMTVVYIYSMSWIGFYIATPIFLVGCFLFLKVTSIKVLVVGPIMMNLVVWVFFDILFKIPIPMGKLIEPILKAIGWN